MEEEAAFQDLFGVLLYMAEETTRANESETDDTACLKGEALDSFLCARIIERGGVLPDLLVTASQGKNKVHFRLGMDGQMVPSDSEGRPVIRALPRVMRSDAAGHATLLLHSPPWGSLARFDFTEFLDLDFLNLRKRGPVPDEESTL